MPRLFETIELQSTITEGQDYTFTLTPRNAFDEAITIRWEIVRQGFLPAQIEDFTQTSDTIIFNAGSADPQTITLPFTDDNVGEVRADFELRISQVQTNLPDILIANQNIKTTNDNDVFSTLNRLRLGDNLDNVMGFGGTHNLEVDGAGGDDIFIITKYQYGNVIIDDVLANNTNTIAFDDGVEITEYRETYFGNNAIHEAFFTLNTGAIITVRGPNGSFNYQIGDSEIFQTLAAFKNEINVQEINGVVALQEAYTADGYLAYAYQDSQTEISRLQLGANSDDIFTFARDIDITINGAAGNDTYIITRHQYGNVRISESVSVNNIIKLDFDLEITNLRETYIGEGSVAEAFLTLSTGAVIIIEGPNGFHSFQIGDGEVLSYDEFKTTIGVREEPSGEVGGASELVLGESFIVQDQNDPIITTAIADQEYEVGGNVIFLDLATFFADNDEGQSLSYSAIVSDARDGGNANELYLDIFGGSSQLIISADTAGTYTAIITATDDGAPAKSVSQSFTITVREPSIVFDDTTPRSFSLDENTDGGVDVGSPITANHSLGAAVSYELIGAPIGFEISGAGQIRYVGAALDFESGESGGGNTISFSVRASVDGRNALEDVAVVVSVQDVDEAPVFSGSFALSMDENIGSGVVGVVGSASDVDGDSITYSLEGADATDFRATETAQGIEISYVGAGLDFETKSFYVFDLVATANGVRVTQEVVVSVQNVDEAPVFSGNYALSLDENIGSGIVGTVGTASDVDGDSITYSLEGVDAADFRATETAQGIEISYVGAGLDFETKSAYRFDLVATANGVRVTQEVVVSIRNMDEAPVFSGSFALSIDENIGGGVVGIVGAASDVDGDSISYSLEGADATDFRATQTEQGIEISYVGTGLDFETKSSYAFDLVAVANGMRATQEVVVSVRDGDDITSLIIEGAIVDEIIESANIASDMETGYTLSIVDEDGLASSYDFAIRISNSIDERFAVESVPDVENSYRVILRAGSNIEAGDYTLSILVYTAGTENIIAQEQVAVSIGEDTPPFFLGGDYTLDIDENVDGSAVTDGVLVGVVNIAVDIDGHERAYTLEGTDASDFRIGRIGTSTIDIKYIGTGFDYETKASYTFDLVAIANGARVTQEVVVSVNNVNEPTYLNIETATIAISSAASAGRDIDTGYRLSIADDDGLAALYNFEVSLADSAETDNRFAVEAIDGVSNSYRLIIVQGSALPAGSYALTITATDSQDNTITAQADISFVVSQDTTPSFSGDYLLNIDENVSGINTPVIIGSVNAATDIDGDSITYELAGDDATDFAVSATDEGTLAITYNGGGLDFETKDTYTFDIVAITDGVRITQEVVVSVNDVVIEFSTLTLSGAMLPGVVAQADVIADITTGIQYTLILDADGGVASDYSFEAVDRNGDVDSRFALRAVEGAEGAYDLIVLAGSDFSAGIYELSIIARSPLLPNTFLVSDSFANLIVPVDTPPVFSGTYEATFAENLDGSQDPIYANGVFAPAVDINGHEITYALEGEDATDFGIDFDFRGNIFLTYSGTGLNHEAKDTYTFNLVAEANGVRTLQEFIVNVNDRDDLPTFTISGENAAIDESTSTSEDILTGYQITFADEDYDGGDVPNFNVHISSDGGATRDLRFFHIVSDDNPFVYDIVILQGSAIETGVVDLTIRIPDRDGVTMGQRETLALHIGDDLPPVFNPAPTDIASITENTDYQGANALTIAQVSATDINRDDITFSLDSVAQGLGFSIDSSTGVITYAAIGLDYESYIGGITLTITAHSSTHTATQDIHVVVENVNEAPVLTITPIDNAELPENTLGKALATISAIDYENDDITYAVLLNGVAPLHFEIDENGILYYNGAGFDYETVADNPEIALTITATAAGATTSETLTVRITDVDEVPVITSVPTDSAIDENYEGRITIGRVMATDEDIGASIFFSFDRNAPAGFAIDENTGEITYDSAIAGAQLDYEATPTIDLTVIARGRDDEGITTHITAARVSIDINDIEEPIIYALEPLTDELEENRNNVELAVLSISDSDGTPISVDISASDAFGTNSDYVLGADNIIRYVGDPLNYEDYVAQGNTEVELTLTIRSGEEEIVRTHSIAIADVNDAPIALPIPTLYTLYEEGDEITINLNDYFYDVDNGAQALAFSVHLSSLYTVLPFVNLNSETGELVLRAGGPESYTITAVAIESGEAEFSTSQSFTLYGATAVDAAPIFEGHTPFAVVEEDRYTEGFSLGQLLTSDADGDEVVITLSQEAHDLGFRVGPGNWLIHQGAFPDYETHSGSITFTATATSIGVSGIAQSDTQELTVFIEDVEEAPEIEMAYTDTHIIADNFSGSGSVIGARSTTSYRGLVFTYDEYADHNGEQVRIYFTQTGLMHELDSAPYAQFQNWDEGLFILRVHVSPTGGTTLQEVIDVANGDYDDDNSRTPLNLSSLGITASLRVPGTGDQSFAAASERSSHATISFSGGAERIYGDVIDTGHSFTISDDDGLESAYTTSLVVNGGDVNADTRFFLEQIGDTTAYRLMIASGSDIDAGTYNIDISVTGADSNLTSQITSFDFTVYPNTAPVSADGIADIEYEEYMPQIDSINLHDVFTDDGGIDEVRFLLSVQGLNGAVAHEAGVSLSEDNHIVFADRDIQPGEYRVIIRAIDSTTPALTGEVSFLYTIHPREFAPVIFDINSNTPIPENTDYTNNPFIIGTIEASDNNGDAITYGVSDASAAAGFAVSAEGVVTYAGGALNHEEGDGTITATVLAYSTNPRGVQLSDSRDLILSIADRPDPVGYEIVSRATAPIGFGKISEATDAVPTGILFRITDEDGLAAEYDFVLASLDDFGTNIEDDRFVLRETDEAGVYSVDLLGGSDIAVGGYTLLIYFVDPLGSSTTIEPLDVNIIEAVPPVITASGTGTQLVESDYFVDSSSGLRASTTISGIVFTYDDVGEDNNGGVILAGEYSDFDGFAFTDAPYVRVQGASNGLFIILAQIGEVAGESATLQDVVDTVNGVYADDNRRTALDVSTLGITASLEVEGTGDDFFALASPSFTSAPFIGGADPVVGNRDTGFILTITDYDTNIDEAYDIEISVNGGVANADDRFQLEAINGREGVYRLMIAEGSNIEAGTYNISIAITDRDDGLRSVSAADVIVEILENTAPTLTAPLQDLIYEIQEDNPADYNLRDYFADDHHNDNLYFTYTVTPLFSPSDGEAARHGIELVDGTRLVFTGDVNGNARDLDYGDYTVRVTATDLGSPALSVSDEFSYRISRPDAAPEITTFLPSFANFDENTVLFGATGYTLGRVLATEENGDAIVFSLDEQAVEIGFSINDNGDIFFAGLVPDHESSNGGITITVTATSTGARGEPLSDTRDILLPIGDVDEPPSFSASGTQNTIGASSLTGDNNIIGKGASVEAFGIRFTFNEAGAHNNGIGRIHFIDAVDALAEFYNVEEVPYVRVSQIDDSNTLFRIAVRTGNYSNDDSLIPTTYQDVLDVINGIYADDPIRTPYDPPVTASLITPGTAHEVFDLERYSSVYSESFAGGVDHALGDAVDTGYVFTIADVDGLSAGFYEFEISVNGGGINTDPRFFLDSTDTAGVYKLKIATGHDLPEGTYTIAVSVRDTFNNVYATTIEEVVLEVENTASASGSIADIQFDLGTTAPEAIALDNLFTDMLYPDSLVYAVAFATSTSGYERGDIAGIDGDNNLIFYSTNILADVYETSVTATSFEGAGGSATIDFTYTVNANINLLRGQAQAYTREDASADSGIIIGVEGLALNSGYNIIVDNDEFIAVLTNDKEISLRGHNDRISGDAGIRYINIHATDETRIVSNIYTAAVFLNAAPFMTDITYDGNTGEIYSDRALTSAVDTGYNVGVTIDEDDGVSALENGLGHTTNEIGFKFYTEAVGGSDVSHAFEVDADGNILGAAGYRFRSLGEQTFYVAASDGDAAVHTGAASLESARQAFTIYVEKNIVIDEDLADFTLLNGGADFDVLVGTDANEFIRGYNRNDDISTGGGTDIIFGGYGLDTITLGAGEKTIIHRINSIDGAWRNDDGADIISNFKYGTDAFVLLDIDTQSPIGVDDLNQNFQDNLVNLQVIFDTQGSSITGFLLRFSEGLGTDGATSNMEAGTDIQIRYSTPILVYNGALRSDTTEIGARLLGANSEFLNAETSSLTAQGNLENFFSTDDFTGLYVLSFEELNAGLTTPFADEAPAFSDAPVNPIALIEGAVHTRISGGAAVATLPASDSDGDAIAYTLAENAPEGFSISPSTGAISFRGTVPSIADTGGFISLTAVATSVGISGQPLSDEIDISVPILAEII